MNFASYLFCQNSKKYKKNKKFISLCDKILLKYMAVDSILYNQIILENLFKDYKWNDGHFYIIENNELINDFNNIIK